MPNNGSSDVGGKLGMAAVLFALLALFPLYVGLAPSSRRESPIMPVKVGEK
jgi:hypothetical protein